MLCFSVSGDYFSCSVLPKFAVYFFYIFTYEIDPRDEGVWASGNNSRLLLAIDLFYSDPPDFSSSSIIGSWAFDFLFDLDLIEDGAFGSSSSDASESFM